MATIYSGALAPKKKQDLQELAADLGIDNTGTKDDLQERIKAHLTAKQELAQHPRFGGLYPSKGRKVRQVSASLKEDTDLTAQQAPKPSTRRAAANVFPTPNEQGVADAAEQAVERIAEETVAAVPPSPTRSIVEFVNKKTQEVLAAADPDAIVGVVREKSRTYRKEVNRGTSWLKTFLSNANNITSLTIVAELLYILYTVIPWEFYAIPLNPPYTTRYTGTPPKVVLPEDPPLVSTRIVSVPYIPCDFLLQPQIYSTLILWALPTLLIPLCIGGLVSFKPGHAWSTSGQDPLTAAIVRIACVFAGEWGLNWSNDLGISSKWRILSASIAGAFSLAEAIGERKAAAPVVEEEEEEAQVEDVQVEQEPAPPVVNSITATPNARSRRIMG